MKWRPSEVFLYGQDWKKLTFSAYIIGKLENNLLKYFFMRFTKTKKEAEKYIIPLPLISLRCIRYIKESVRFMVRPDVVCCMIQFFHDFHGKSCRNNRGFAIVLFTFTTNFSFSINFTSYVSNSNSVLILYYNGKQLLKRGKKLRNFTKTKEKYSDVFFCEHCNSIQYHRISYQNTLLFWCIYTVIEKTIKKN